MLIGARLLTWAADHRPTEDLKFPLGSIPSQIAGWSASRELTLSPGVLKALATKEYLDRIYVAGPLSAELFIAFYPVQRAGETMHSPNACLPGSGWEFSGRAVRQLQTAGGVVTVNRDEIRKDGANMWLLYWYQSHNTVIADEYASKFLLFRQAFSGGHTSGSFVRITAREMPGSLAAIIKLAEEAVPAVRRCMSD
jgi:EpsI family protein